MEEENMKRFEFANATDNAARSEYDPVESAYWMHLARAFTACAVQYGAAYMVKGVGVC